MWTFRFKLNLFFLLCARILSFVFPQDNHPPTSSTHSRLPPVPPPLLLLPLLLLVVMLKIVVGLVASVLRLARFGNHHSHTHIIQWRMYKERERELTCCWGCGLCIIGLLTYKNNWKIATEWYPKEGVKKSRSSIFLRISQHSFPCALSAFSSSFSLPHAVPDVPWRAKYGCSNILKNHPRGRVLLSSPSCARNVFIIYCCQVLFWCALAEKGAALSIDQCTFCCSAVGLIRAAFMYLVGGARCVPRALPGDELLGYHFVFLLLHFSRVSLCYGGFSS